MPHIYLIKENMSHLLIGAPLVLKARHLSLQLTFVGLGLPAGAQSFQLSPQSQLIL